MKDLSIVIRASKEKVIGYVKALNPIILNSTCELIIINNTIDCLDIDHNYTLYKFSGGNKKFKEFCFSSSQGKKVMIIDGDMQLTSSIVDDVIMHICSSDFSNISYKTRKFLSSDKPIYYKSDQVLIYNRGIKGFNIESQLTIDDFTLLDDTSIENNLNKLIEHKSFNELYLWYKHFILRNTSDLKEKFYELLEFEKTVLDNVEREYLDELFIIGNEDKDYCEYLSLKRELFKNNNLNNELFSKKMESLSSIYNERNYSWIVNEIIRDRHDLFAFLITLDGDLLKSIVDYLLNYNSFHEYLYGFISEINKVGDGYKPIKFSIANLTLIKLYLAFASKLQGNPELLNKLLNLFDNYVNVKEKILSDGNFKGTQIEDPSEMALITNYKRALMHSAEGNINKAAEILRTLSIEYPVFESVLRHCIQKIRFEKDCYESVLSICMIVKDEEKNLHRCLSSLKPLLDAQSELIIVDTGSGDKTVEIAGSYTDKVFFHKWQGSFSTARNYCLSLAEGEYVFLVDGDEEIPSVEINKIIEAFKSSSYRSYNTFTLKVKNYTDVNLKEYAIITQPRIFRNNTEFYYSGKVHNQPIFKLPVKHLQIYITHYGYIMTEDIKDKKFQRTANMLKVELQKNPQNIYYRFQLSTSYAMHGDLKEALGQAEIYMRKIRSEGLVNDDYIMYFNNAALLYISSHLLDEASNICDMALKVCPNFIDFIYYKALIYYETGEYEGAIEYTNKYLKLIDNYMDIDIANDGRYSFYTLGLKNDVTKIHILSNDRLGEYEEIINTIGSLDKTVYKECLHAIVHAYWKSSRYTDLISFYKSYCTDKKSKLVFRYFLEDYVQKSDKREKQLGLTILEGLNSCGDKQEDLRNIINSKYSTDINAGLFIIENYDIDSLNLYEAKGLFNKLLPLYNSFNTDEAVDVNEIILFEKLGLYILKRSSELKYFRDYSVLKQIHILRKYMSLSSAIIKNKRTDLLEAREQLFLIKITEAFKQLGASDYNAAVKLLEESFQVYRPMEGLVDLIIKNVLPDYKNTTNNTRHINIISNNDENIKSYANVVKEKIAEAAGASSPKCLLEIFTQFNKKELYDPELFSYKALLLMSEDSFEEAELEINEGLLRYPNDIRLLSNLSKLHSLTHSFKKSIVAFCRAKILYKDKCTLKLSQLIPEDYFTQNSHRLKILHGTMIGDNAINKIAEEISKKGIYTKTLNYSPKYTGYSSDYVIDMNQYESGTEILNRTLDAASILIPEFDIFHFHYGNTLTFDYSDLPLLNELGKKVIVQFWGDEVKISQNDANLNSSTLYRNKKITIQEKLANLSLYVDSCVVPNEEVYGYVKDYFNEIHIIKENQIDKLIALYKSLNCTKK